MPGGAMLIIHLYFLYLIWYNYISIYPIAANRSGQRALVHRRTHSEMENAAWSFIEVSVPNCWRFRRNVEFVTWAIGIWCVLPYLKSRGQRGAIGEDYPIYLFIKLTRYHR